MLLPPYIFFEVAAFSERPTNKIEEEVIVIIIGAVPTTINSITMFSARGKYVHVCMHAFTRANNRLISLLKSTRLVRYYKERG